MNYMEQMTITAIPVRKAARSRLPEVDWDHLEFGAHTSDHMLVADYAGGAWKEAQVLPFANFSLSPTALGLHYGQTIFEGMKAFRMEDGSINIFRPQKHYERLVRSADRMCMPVVSREMFLDGLRTLIGLDGEWVSGRPGYSLYIRPFIIATEARLGVKVSEAYRYAVVCSPARSLYGQPLRVKVEREFIRAARGGTGYAKCGGNYGASFYPTRIAKEQGYDQVLWTDGAQNNFIEESGTMNVMFVIDGTLVTPPLSDSILDGVTRDSLLKLAERAGIPVEERRIGADELIQCFEKKTISEAFGAGTAAVVSPIQSIGIDDRDYYLPEIKAGNSIAGLLKGSLEDIRHGRVQDPFGWNLLV
jgi:branched-chain amino acid aminotransferase